MLRNHRAILKILYELSRGEAGRAMAQLHLLDLPVEYVREVALSDLLEAAASLPEGEQIDIVTAFIEHYASDLRGVPPFQPAAGSQGDFAAHFLAVHDHFYRAWRTSRASGGDIHALAGALGLLWWPTRTEVWERQVPTRRVWERVDRLLGPSESVIRRDVEAPPAEERILALATALVGLQAAAPRQEEAAVQSVLQAAKELHLSFDRAPSLSRRQERPSVGRPPRADPKLVGTEHRPALERLLRSLDAGLAVSTAGDSFLDVGSGLGVSARNGAFIVVSDSSVLSSLERVIESQSVELYGVLTDREFVSRIRHERWGQDDFEGVGAPPSRGGDVDDGEGTRWGLYDEEGREPDATRQVRGGLLVAKEVWQREIEGEHSLRLVLFAPKPIAADRGVVEAQPPSPSEMTFQQPALAILPGSLWACIVRGGVTVGGFVIALCTRGGLAPSMRSHQLAERMRQWVQENGNAEPLSRVNEIVETDIAASRGLVIFIHGLLSTDLGTFDPLVRRLRASGFTLAGFPHNTLVSIGTNAQDLADQLNSLSTSEEWPVLFICHSRGGLVARAAIVKLLSSPSRAWRQRIRGCVTLGTPHNGACLAESEEEFTGLFLVGTATGGPHKLSALVDVLVIRRTLKTLPGISDLRPRVTGKEFIAELERDEVATDKPMILAFGGKAQPQGARGWIAVHALGSAENDLVVELSSTLPVFVRSERRIQTVSNHFCYLDDPSTVDATVQFVVDRLSQPAPPRGPIRRLLRRVFRA